MRTDLFDFDLPPDRIALRPASPRDSARLLVVRPAASGSAAVFEDRIIRDLPHLLLPGDQIVVNDTKVIPAQLSGRRVGGASEPRIEATLIKRLDGSRWQALVKPARKLKPGDIVRFGEEQPESSVCFLGQLDATVEAKGEAGEVTLAFAFHGPVLDQAIAERGELPLPPYIASRRAPDARDRTDYQTMFAREEGAVAAPTAGLHFTPEILDQCRAAGADIAYVTLHVGLGTFQPLHTEVIEQARLHSEVFEIDEANAERIKAARRRVAVGTTTVRTLETAELQGGVRAMTGETDLFIYPGFQFRATGAMLTNFHLPRSSLLVLVSAFAGREFVLEAYRHAVAERYRFFSYGDCMLIL